jgi:cytochrome bd-type quinol oxidase subunit 2
MVSRVGTGVIAVLFLAGLWLVAAPFALRFQPPHHAWGGATKADVIVGGLLAATCFGGLLAVLAGRVREMYSDRS